MTEAELMISALPAALIILYFFGGLAVYAVRSARQGHIRDANLEGRGSTAILGMWIRLYFAWIMRPVFGLLRATGLPPDAITTLSALFATGGAVALAAGRFTLGGWLLLCGGICDFLDGRLAREQGSTSPSGAALDSVLDRYSDAVVLIGLGWYYRSSPMLLVVMTLMMGALLVSYVRARGEGLGVAIKGGLAQRAERVVVLGVALFFSPMLEAVLPSPEVAAGQPLYWLGAGAVVLLALLAMGTAYGRLARLHRALGGSLFAGAGGARQGSLARHSVASAAATAADAGLVMALVAMAHTAPWLATAAGCVLGAVVNFTLGRVWAFDGRGASVRAQAPRYALVSGTSAALNAGGVALLMLLPSVTAAVAWLVARALVFVVWNYPLQKHYVFATDPTGATPMPQPAPATSPTVTPEPPRPRPNVSAPATGAAAALCIAALGASIALGANPAPAAAQGNATFVPTTSDDGDYSESWTAIADLQDGTYVQLQLAVSNIGPGDLNGVCRALVVAPSAKAWTGAKTVDDDAWEASKDKGLRIGRCKASVQGKTMRYTARVGGGSVEVVLSAAPRPKRPPQSKLTVDDATYTTELLTPWAPAKVTVNLPGAASKTLTGTGYADHTRSLLLPGPLARKWVRLRALGASGSVLMLARYPAGKGGPRGWVWRQEDARWAPLKTLKLTRKGKAWAIDFATADHRWSVTTTRQLYRHAPVEEHGVLGSVVGAVVGNPVTYTHRASPQGDTAMPARAIVEISLTDE